MKFLVSGCGSIGIRHIKNLKYIGIEGVIAFDPVDDRRNEVYDKFGIDVYKTFEEGLDKRPDAVVIASPTSLHLEQGISAARRGCHLFIEKPISHTVDSVDELINIVNSKKLITLIGYNLRHNPVIRKVKEILEAKLIGRVLSGYVECGTYLPDWHPQEDYRKGYSARNELGGGVILDISHEIDCVMWLLGNITEVFSFTENLSSLEIDTEDIADILVKFESEAHGYIHLDYLQRAASRTGKIIGEDGTVVWDILDGEVMLYTADSGKWELVYSVKNFDFNQVYVDEMRYFIDCVEKNEKASPDEIDGKKVLEVGLAAKKSSIEGKKVSI